MYEVPRQSLDIETTNAIQMRLMEMSEDNPETWVDAHAATFRELVSTHPEWVRAYENDPEACVAIIKKALEERILH